MKFLLDDEGRPPPPWLIVAVLIALVTLEATVIVVRLLDISLIRMTP